MVSGRDLMSRVMTFVTIGLPVGLKAECLEVFDIIAEVEGCVSSLNAFKGHALRGTFNSRRKTLACQDYAESIACTDELIDACGGYHDTPSREIAVEFKKDQEDGFGKMCNADGSYYAEYSSFSHCYKRVSNSTNICLDDFTKAQDIEVCDSITRLRKCVDDAVRPTCGLKASEFYFELCKHQVPSNMFTHCYTTLPPRDPSPQPMSAGIALGSQSYLVWSLTALVAVTVI